MKLVALLFIALMGLSAVAQNATPTKIENIAKLRAKAEKGDATAQNNLGVMYANGNGVAKDPAEAANWHRKAADQGFASAQYNLGVRYDNGNGVAKDPAEAVKWYRKAADQGVASAQFNLGVMYANGIGVLKDEIEALGWFNIASISGGELAIENRSLLEHRLGPQAALSAQQRSKELLRQIEAKKTQPR